MTNILAVAILGLAGTISTLSYAEDAVRLECPSEIHVRAEFGALTIPDAADQDFVALSGSTLESDFARVHSEDGCVFVQSGPSVTSLKRQFMEVRRHKNGETSLILEGYTSMSSKLYSIRAWANEVLTLDGNFDGLVFDGSGPNRSRLGSARLNIEAIPSRN